MDLLEDGAGTLRAKWTSAAGHRGNSPVRGVISTGRFGRISSSQTRRKGGGDHGGRRVLLGRK